jgi:hypothetical protein
VSQWILVERMLYAPAMSIESEAYRKRAQDQREEAERATLPNAKARALHAAERWDVMAQQAERANAATIKRDADKAVRDAERAGLD